jgi:hypothetical protein
VTQATPARRVCCRTKCASCGCRCSSVTTRSRCWSKCCAAVTAAAAAAAAAPRTQPARALRNLALLLPTAQTQQTRPGRAATLARAPGTAAAAAAAARRAVQARPLLPCCLRCWTPACCRTGTRHLRRSGRTTGTARCGEQRA